MINLYPMKRFKIMLEAFGSALVRYFKHVGEEQRIVSKFERLDIELFEIPGMKIYYTWNNNGETFESNLTPGQYFELFIGYTKFIPALKKSYEQIDDLEAQIAILVTDLKKWKDNCATCKRPEQVFIGNIDTSKPIMINQVEYVPKEKMG